MRGEALRPARWTSGGRSTVSCHDGEITVAPPRAGPTMTPVQQATSRHVVSWLTTDHVSSAAPACSIIESSVIAHVTALAYGAEIATITIAASTVRMTDTFLLIMGQMLVTECDGGKSCVVQHSRRPWITCKKMMKKCSQMQRHLSDSQDDEVFVLAVTRRIDLLDVVNRTDHDDHHRRVGAVAREVFGNFRPTRDVERSHHMEHQRIRSARQVLTDPIRHRQTVQGSRAG